MSTGLVFEKADLEQFRTTRDCVECDLVGADLMEANLERAKLEEADLRGAYLKRANLGWTILIES
ncbi:MAG: pentapeptide repeat-containing protein [Spirulina sp. SIO3F2]|nr:pentapeptide repeat-containing protein [Spirulina sp. SIO3F2]